LAQAAAKCDATAAIPELHHSREAVVRGSSGGAVEERRVESSTPQHRAAFRRALEAWGAPAVGLCPSSAGRHFEVEAVERGPQGLPELCRGTCHDQGHLPGMREDTTGDAQDPFAETPHTPALLRRFAEQHPGGVKDVVGEGIEEQ
jgi:hypothetical protein